MAIDPALIASYAPWGNAELAFEVGDGDPTPDPTTGNLVQTPLTLEYLAAVNIEAPAWREAPGVDQTSYSCRGRLLTPVLFDSRIVNGSQAQATINGAAGRFELTFDLAMDAFHRRDLRQSFQGTFRLVGGPGS